MMLQTLDSRFRVLDASPAASERDIARLRSAFLEVPADYLEIIRAATELELEWAHSKYLRIWGPGGVLEMNAAYSISDRLPGSLPCGDDGGGMVLVYLDGAQGRGVYRSGLGDLDPTTARWIAPSLRAILVDGSGMESF
jgi:hypothetical protein